ncbi:MAG: Hsp33 family molecular chaperone HslO [Candidatus Baltobacteraceae bacterium]
MPDELLAARADDGSVAVVAGITTELVRDAQARHGLAPTASATLGRLLTAAALLGTGLKGRERLTLQIAADGPIGSVVADAFLVSEREIGVRGLVQHPLVDLPLNEWGKFDVAGAVGSGRLQVTRSYEVGQPYVGVVPLASGEIGEDVAAYLHDSEQIPSVVALGVLADPNGIAAAGGAIAQVLPGADQAAISALEQRAQTVAPLTRQIVGGADPEALVASLVGAAGFRRLETYTVRFVCRCTREKVELALLGLGRDELDKMVRERESTEAVCDFCNRRYLLSSEEIAHLVTRLNER